MTVRCNRAADCTHHNCEGYKPHERHIGCGLRMCMWRTVTVHGIVHELIVECVGVEG
jgi:hypothetical protein